jgi:Trk K+ transport system NAD-binding subunit
MTPLSRRALYYLLVLVGATALFTTAYALGMRVWEGRPRAWYRALEVVIQTFTTTGYGEDAPWQSPQMNLLVIVMQLAGIGFILSAVDVFVVPWLRAALRPTAPTAVAERNGHVVVCGYTPRVEVFVAEMEARGQEYVFVEAEAERAGTLYEEEHPVMTGDPTTTEALRRAHVGTARALVADVADDENASVALAAREVAPDVRIITLVEDAALARYHEAAGADAALSPRRLLGRSLAAQVPVAAAANVEESVAKADEIEFAEVTITPRSPLYGRPLGAVRREGTLRGRVVGAWVDGTFETSVADDQVLDDSTRLFLAGTPDQLAALRDAMPLSVRPFHAQSILVAGYGDSGRAVCESIREAGGAVTVLDIRDREGVDVVGDVRDPEVLQRAGIETASALVVAVDDDTVATFATLIARELTSDLQVLVRAQEEASVQNLYRAGADFVQALPTVCGRMLAATVLEEGDLWAAAASVSVLRLPIGAREGEPVSTLVSDAQTNYTILAVCRDEDFLTDLDAAPPIEADDEIIVAGTEEGLQQVRDRLSG